MLEQLNIKTQILGSFIVLATIILVFISSIALVNISLVGDNTQNLAIKAMEDQINRNMLLTSNETAQIIEKKVSTAEAVIQSLSNAAEQLFSQDLDVYEYKDSFLDLNVSNIPQAQYDEDYNGTISTFASTYYVPLTTLNNLSVISPEMNITISRSSHLDVVFKSFYKDYPEFTWLKVAFKEGEILRRYPASIVNMTRIYDPTKELWYTKARDARKGTIILTDPYIEPVVNEWIITVAKAIFYGDGNILGVMAADLKLKLIQDEVDKIHFLKTGYAALVLQNGKVVAHPRWEETTETLMSIADLEVNQDDTIALNDSLLLEILSKDEGIAKFVKDNKKYLVSHSPISPTFVLLIFVQESEAVEAVIEIENNIDNAQLQVTFITIIVSFLTFVVVLGVGLWVANRISKPIVNLSESALRIVSSVTDRDFIQKVDFDDSLAQDDEIGQLSKSFSHMIDSMKDQYTKFCRKCGTKYGKLDDFCKKCGELRPIK